MLGFCEMVEVWGFWRRRCMCTSTLTLSLKKSKDTGSRQFIGVNKPVKAKLKKKEIRGIGFSRQVWTSRTCPHQPQCDKTRWFPVLCSVCLATKILIPAVHVSTVLHLCWWLSAGTALSLCCRVGVEVGVFYLLMHNIFILLQVLGDTIMQPTTVLC